MLYSSSLLVFIFGIIFMVFSVLYSQEIMDDPEEWHIFFFPMVAAFASGLIYSAIIMAN